MNKFIKITDINNYDENILQFLMKELIKGKIIIVGTDTVYGISGNALDVDVVKKIYEIKKRDFSKPISICLKDTNEIEKYAYVNDLAKKIIDNFLPGPLTIILKKKDIIPDIVAKEYIGIRVPDVKFTRDLCTVPLTTTSANISGNKEAYRVEDIDKEVIKKVDYVVDIGECKYKKPSTVIKIENNNIKLVREGIIKFDDILDII